MIPFALAALVVFGARAVAHDAAAGYEVEGVLLLLGYSLALIGYLAGPPDYRKPWNAVSSR